MDNQFILWQKESINLNLAFSLLFVDAIQIDFPAAIDLDKNSKPILENYKTD